jgi:hypothetical protein
MSRDKNPDEGILEDGKSVFEQGDGDIRSITDIVKISFKTPPPVAEKIADDSSDGIPIFEMDENDVSAVIELHMGPTDAKIDRKGIEESAYPSQPSGLDEPEPAFIHSKRPAEQRALSPSVQDEGAAPPEIIERETSRRIDLRILSKGVADVSAVPVGIGNEASTAYDAVMVKND